MKILNWPGAKWSIANKIIQLMPKHKIYLEPFFGSGAIFFNKPQCNLEILNDLDGEVVNLFKCIRDNPNKLANLLYFTPYSKYEYTKSYNRSGSNLEKARQFLVRSNMARASMQYYSSSWKISSLVMGLKAKKRFTGEWNKIPSKIIEVASRLKDAEIENTDAIKLIEKYNSKECLIYADPPYLLSTRKQRYYSIEMTEEAEHKKLLKSLIKHSGMVVISGYESELYNDLLSSWTKIKISTIAEQGKKRIEVIWINFNIQKQLSLFE